MPEMNDPKQPAPTSRCRTVLVVDDHEGIRESTCEALEEEGYVVFCAANGEEALRILRARTSPCLVLLDLKMPVLSGWDTLKLMKDDPTFAQHPVVVVSVQDPRGQLPVGIRHFRKPVPFEELLAVVEEYCGPPAPRTPESAKLEKKPPSGAGGEKPSVERLRWVRTHPERLAANERVWQAWKASAEAQGEPERAAARTRYLAAIEELQELEAELGQRYEAGEGRPK
jgi:CheY-like chemotaxis protein